MILIYAVLAVLLCWFPAHLHPTGPWVDFFDACHWTISAAAGAWIAWAGSRVRDVSPELRRIRRWFAGAMLVFLVGQLVDNVLNYLDRNAFPGPSDLLFMLVGPIFIGGFASFARSSLPVPRRRILVLDCTGFTLTLLILTLTLYLPHGNGRGLLLISAYAAYPVAFTCAGVIALVMQLHLRQRWSMPWFALFIGLCGYGVLWLAWNLLALENPIHPGTFLNLGFSLCTLLAGWGAARWQPGVRTSPGYDRSCEALLRQLPLALVTLNFAAIGLLLVNTGVPESARSLLLVLGLGVLLIAVVRQTQQLGERDRLIAAELVVAESREKLRHLAHHDPLTGLPNRNQLRERVLQAMAKAQRQGTRVALMFVDLDQFKEINDSLGHAVGDALLCHIAQLLADTLRRSDTVSRQGGDEFALVLPDLPDADAAARAAEKIMQISRGSAHLLGHELPMSMSLGVALYPDDAQDFDSLLKCADTAMYRAKEAGRNTFRFYDAQMSTEAAQRMQMRARLSHAIERHELELHYQPQVDLRTGALCGAEALLRWNSPELGRVPPAQFIPVAEDAGLIVEIGRWVLEQACRQAADWSARGLPPLRLAVNLSVLQFRRGNLELQVQEALRISGLDPQRLELEVTESVLMQDKDRVFATIERISALGVRFAIDDFGTGYSSLAYVRRMRVNKLKIDKSFLHEALVDPGSAGIVRAMIGMAHALNVMTVGEGVETEEQRAFLDACRCDAAQGYLFSRPLAAAEFERYQREHARQAEADAAPLGA